MSDIETRLNADGRERKPRAVSLVEVNLARRTARRKKFLRHYPDMGSVSDLFTPYAARLYEGRKEPVEVAEMCAQLASKTSREARKFLRKWENWPPEHKLFDHEFDFCVTECKLNLDEFKRLLVSQMNAVAKNKARAIIETALPELALKALTIAGEGERDKNNRVLQRILESHDLLDKPPGQVPVVVDARQQTVINPGPSADEFSQQLDRALQAREQKQLPASVDAEFEEVKS